MPSPARPRNGDNAGGMPRRMHKAAPDALAAHPNPPRVGGYVCPTCVQFGSCKEHPAGSPDNEGSNADA